MRARGWFKLMNGQAVASKALALVLDLWQLPLSKIKRIGCISWDAHGYPDKSR